MKFPILAGIDFSMTCPGVAVYNPKDGKFCSKNLKLHYTTEKKKLVVKTDYFIGHLTPKWSSPEERFDYLANWALSLIPEGAIIAIESYSYNSKGMNYQIGENCGVLKNKLYLRHHLFQIVEPLVLKKFACGFGGASKLEMLKQFCLDDPEGFKHIQSSIEIKKEKVKKLKNGRTKGNILSPVQDVVDAYYLCKYLHSAKRT